MDDFQRAMFDLFTLETTDFLDKLESILIDMEAREQSIIASVPEIFRIMHTIKGSSAMLSLDNISRLAHAVEDLFNFLRSNPDSKPDPSMLVDIVLKCCDFIKRNLVPDMNEDSKPLIDEVKGYLSQLKQPAAAPVKAEPQKAVGDFDSLKIRVLFKPGVQMIGVRAFEVHNRVSRLAGQILSTPDPEQDADGIEELFQKSGMLMEMDPGAPRDDVIAKIKSSPFVLDAFEEKDAPVAPPVVEKPPEKPPEKAPEKPPEKPPEKSSPAEQPLEERQRGARAQQSYANVPISRLDELVDLSGELAIAQLALQHAINGGDKAAISRRLFDVSSLTEQLQRAALASRMVSLQDTFHKLNRAARDVVRKLSKDVQITFNGGDTELDKNVIELLSPPLMHIVRNSVDHGIEMPDERTALGKDRAGSLEVSAALEGNEVSITITDDGRGFDREKILKKALASKFVTEEQAAAFTPEEINRLIFLPGFSTNEDVTEFSGRGVGMDVVNENIKKLGGSVTVYSEQGIGTQVALKIPLTRAIADVMLLKTGENICALPVSVVTRVFEPNENRIREINGSDAVLYDGQCYRLFHLSTLYGGAPKGKRENGVMVLVHGGDAHYVIFVDAIVDYLNIVVKPVPPLLKSRKTFYGCTVLGDGSVCLILSAAGIAQSHTELADAGILNGRMMEDE